MATLRELMATSLPARGAKNQQKCPKKTITLIYLATPLFQPWHADTLDGPERSALRIERSIDQRVVGAIDLAVAVAIAVEPAADVLLLGDLLVKCGVDPRVVGAVNSAVEVGVAVVSVLHQHHGVVERDAVESRPAREL